MKHCVCCFPAPDGLSRLFQLRLSILKIAVRFVFKMFKVLHLLGLGFVVRGAKGAVGVRNHLELFFATLAAERIVLVSLRMELQGREKRMS